MATLSRKQICAMLWSKKIARSLAAEYPEIADDYRRGRTGREISKLYGFADEFRTSDEISRAAVEFAIAELIPRDERRRLCYEHLRRSGRERYEMGEGIFSMTDEERDEANRRSLIARGHVPFSPQELGYFLRLCRYKKYRHGKGAYESKPNFPLIAAELERKFGTDRKTFTLCLKYHSEMEKRGAETDKIPRSPQGHATFSDEETHYFISICNLRQFRHQGGFHDGKINFSGIAAQLERRFGIRRGESTLRFKRKNWEEKRNAAKP